MDDNSQNIRKRNVKDLKENVKENVKDLKENVASSFENVTNKIKEQTHSVQQQLQHQKENLLANKNINWVALGYGVLCYSIYTWTFIHFVLWLSNSTLLNKTIDFDYTTTTASTSNRPLISYIPVFNWIYMLPGFSWFSKLRLFTFINNWIFSLPVINWFSPFFTTTTTTTTIPSILTETFWSKLLIDFGLFGLFALHHVLILNRSIQRNLSKYLPEPIIHCTNVMIASALLTLFFSNWRPLTTVSPIAQYSATTAIPGYATTATVTPNNIYTYPIGAQYVNTVWTWPANHYILREILNYTFYFGVGLMAIAGFFWDQFDMLGMTRFFKYATGLPYESNQFTVRGAYKFVSHPIMTGMLLAFWCTPIMSYSRFFLCILATTLIVYGMGIENKQLGIKFGAPYEEYMKNTPALFPLRLGFKRPVIVQEREEELTAKKQPERDVIRNHPASTASA